MTAIALLPAASRGIRVNVAFAKGEREKLLAYPTSGAIQAVVDSGLVIPLEQFYTYFLFHRKRDGIPGYGSYREIAPRIGLAHDWLRDLVQFTGGSVQLAPSVRHPGNTCIEQTGETIGLSVISAIHGLTAADWGPIPTTSRKTFDYSLASDGHQLVEVETKGTTSDGPLAGDRISDHKRDIAAKKNELREREGNAIPIIRYGTIATISSKPGSTAGCLLVDPPHGIAAQSAVEARVIQRLRYYRDVISLIAPSSQFATALQTRVAALNKMRSPSELDGVPLVRGDGEPFEDILSGSRPKVRGIGAPGRFIKLRRADILFVGIDPSLVRALTQQKFDSIGSFRREGIASVATIDYDSPPKGAFAKLALGRWAESRKDRSISMRALVFAADSGLLHAVIEYEDPDVEGPRE